MVVQRIVSIFVTLLGVVTEYAKERFGPWGDALRPFSIDTHKKTILYVMLTEYQKALIFFLKRAGFEEIEITVLVNHYEQEEQDVKDKLLIFLRDKNPTKQEVLEFMAKLLTEE